MPAVCTGACDGFARIAGSPAVALLHLGPGLGNGLCNLHNAHRARSPVLVLVGEHATWHKAADPPLAQNIQALASTVSGKVLSIAAADSAASTVQEALEALAGPKDASSTSSDVVSRAPGVDTCPSSRVVTLVFPHDVSWTPAPTLNSSAASLAGPAATALVHHGAAVGAGSIEARLSASPAARRFLSDCAAAMQRAPRGKVALVLGGNALLSTGMLGELHVIMELTHLTISGLSHIGDWVAL